MVTTLHTERAVRQFDSGFPVNERLKVKLIIIIIIGKVRQM